MTMKEAYTDRFEFSLDDKGRLSVPVEWRGEAFEKRFLVIPSADGCLRVYPASFLGREMEKLSNMGGDLGRCAQEKFGKTSERNSSDRAGSAGPNHDSGKVSPTCGVGSASGVGGTIGPFPSLGAQALEKNRTTLDDL